MYRVHRLDIRMSRDREALERYLNSLGGEIVAVIPHTTTRFFWTQDVDFVLVVEKDR